MSRTHRIATSASGDGYRADGFGAGCAQYQCTLVQGRARRQDVIEQYRCLPRTSLFLRKAKALRKFCIRSTRSNRVWVLVYRRRSIHRRTGSRARFGERFGEGVGLVKSAFSQSGRVKRDRHEAIDGSCLYSRVLHGFDEKLGEDMAQDGIGGRT